MRASYIFAWLLPLLLGSGLWWLLAGARRHGDWAAAAGSGWLVGVFAAAAGASWLARSDTVQAFPTTMPWLLGFALLAWIGVALRLRRGLAWAGSEVQRMPPVGRLLWWLLLAMILARFLLIGDEASLRPVFPWDAWSAWAVKAKTWMLLGHVDPYVPMSDWLARPTAATRALATWNYPEWLAWIQVWFASGAGGWNEPLVNLAWSGALAAFALAAYGYWRGFGLSPLLAIGLVYGLVSLPLLDAHAALAGYADLWVAVTLGLAVLAWTRWLLYRERGQWLLGVGLALCLPAIKLEGAVWLLAFSAVVVLDLLPSQWRWRVAGVVAALALLGVLIGGFALPMLGLGWVHVAWGSVRIPMLTTYDLAWHPVGGAMLTSLFALPNWHLLWYLFPLLLAWRWQVLLRERAARLLGLLVLLCVSFLFALFFFTGAAAWAKDFTSANRLILQIVPTVFVFSAVLLRGVSFSAAAPNRSLGSPVPISRA